MAATSCISCTVVVIVMAAITSSALAEGLYESVCYEEGLGCFTDELPCHRDFFPPMSPTDMGTQFTLHTRDRRNATAALRGPEPVEMLAAWGHQFNRERRTIFIIHGWGMMEHKEWVPRLKEALLDKADFNVIIVNWSDGANDINYMKTIQNIRVVGRQVATIVTQMKKRLGLDRSTVHLIGHSLGAHAAGYAGKHVQGIGRITGLDAAGPGFEGTEAGCRLDRDDAMFVDVMHTSASSLLQGGVGIEQQIGHVDFYPNGGRDQPGCRWWMLGCDHARSHAYFIESLRGSLCTFPAVPCETLGDFRSGKFRLRGGALRQRDHGWPPMGYDAANVNNSLSTTEGCFYLKTSGRAPYCRDRHPS